MGFQDIYIGSHKVQGNPQRIPWIKKSSPKPQRNCHIANQMESNQSYKRGVGAWCRAHLKVGSNSRGSRGDAQASSGHVPIGSEWRGREPGENQGSPRELREARDPREAQGSPG